MQKTRITSTVTDINMKDVHDLYADRAVHKSDIDVDAPVVLCSDTDPEHIKHWNTYECEKMLPLLKLDDTANVLELGFGTGRIARYIIPTANSYVGIDYVSEFVESVKRREDIISLNKEPVFLYGSFEDLVSGKLKLPRRKFNRFVISGGVLMYINDESVKDCIRRLVDLLDDKCIIYISEPIAIKERLTLNQFYSDSMNTNYSAIYRTDEEYQIIFSPFYESGFKNTFNREFFEEDIKGQKETRQWMYVFER